MFVGHCNTMSQFTKTFVLFFCAVSQGILVPGPCPLTIPTIFIEDLDFIVKGTLYGHAVPHANLSLFFRKPFAGHKYYSIYSDRETIEHIAKTLVVVTKWSRDGSFLKMESSLKNDVERRFKGCKTTTTDKVKVWFDSNVFIFWSCVQMNKTSSDQAVLILTSDINLSNEDPEKLAELIKNKTRTYLTEPLFNSIQWDNTLDFDNTSTGCLSPNLGWTPLGYFILLSMIVASALFSTSRIIYYWARISNRTHPQYIH